jgi:hypothetical protein
VQQVPEVRLLHVRHGGGHVVGMKIARICRMTMDSTGEKVLSKCCPLIVLCPRPPVDLEFVEGAVELNLTLKNRLEVKKRVS